MKLTCYVCNEYAVRTVLDEFKGIVTLKEPHLLAKDGHFKASLCRNWHFVQFRCCNRGTIYTFTGHCHQSDAKAVILSLKVPYC